VTRAEVGPGKLDDSPVMVDLLAAAIGDRGRRLDETAHRYRHDPSIKLLVAVIGSQVVGLVGYIVGDAEVTLLHIATVESMRRGGIGTQLVAAVDESVDHRLPLVAETDHMSIAFYQALDFTVESLGHKYPGVERFMVYRSDGRAQRRR
jgi:ribosomal protein S18 acetylase RimI-like enzyme